MRLYITIKWSEVQIRKLANKFKSIKRKWNKTDRYSATETDRHRQTETDREGEKQNKQQKGKAQSKWQQSMVAEREGGGGEQKIAKVLQLKRVFFFFLPHCCCCWGCERQSGSLKCNNNKNWVKWQMAAATAPLYTPLPRLCLTASSYSAASVAVHVSSLTPSASLAPLPFPSQHK